MVALCLLPGGLKTLQQIWDSMCLWWDTVIGLLRYWHRVLGESCLNYSCKDCLMIIFLFSGLYIIFLFHLLPGLTCLTSCSMAKRSGWPRMTGIFWLGILRFPFDIFLCLLEFFLVLKMQIGHLWVLIWTWHFKVNKLRNRYFLTGTMCEDKLYISMKFWA